MAFKVRTETKPLSSGVTVREVPAEFLAAMDAEYARVTEDPTREIVIAGETAAETTLYVQYAKAWGGMHEPKLLVTKNPARKGDAELDARITIVDASKAPKRGRAAKPAAEAKAEAPKPTAPKGK